MIIVFDVYDFKDIQRVCGPVLSDNEARIALTYMDLEFKDNRCCAYGSNGYMVSKVDVPCNMTEQPVDAYKVLLRPVKIPAKTKRVILNTNDPEMIDITFYGKDMDVTGEASQPVLHADTLPYEEKFIGPAVDRIEQAERNRNGYMICVDPKYLINALTGLREKEAVVFNFSGPDSAFLIRPYPNDGLKELALVMPRRM